MDTRTVIGYVHTTADDGGRFEPLVEMLVTTDELAQLSEEVARQMVLDTLAEVDPEHGFTLDMISVTVA
jgi:hypothetical protein